jgi:hypothetical protein
MQPCKSILVRTGLFLVFLLATIPAFSQRGTIGIDAGVTSDKFGAQPQATAPDLGLDGKFNLLKAKDGGPNIVVGAELRVPSDTSAHAIEYAIFGGPIFPWGNLSIGFNVGIRKIVQPHAQLPGIILDRYNLELLETPVVLKYKFGPDKRAFIEAQGGPEFTPHFKSSLKSLSGVPHPDFDHGYTIRGSLGYNLGKWYVKGTYETRYFKFLPDVNNPAGMYNWRSNNISGGVGLNF